MSRIMSRPVLEAVIVILVVLWLVGVFVYPGGPINALLFIAMIAGMGRIFWRRSEGTEDSR